MRHWWEGLELSKEVKCLARERERESTGLRTRERERDGQAEWKVEAEDSLFPLSTDSLPFVLRSMPKIKKKTKYG